MVWIARPLVKHAVVMRMKKGEISEAGLAMIYAVAIASALIIEAQACATFWVLLLRVRLYPMRYAALSWIGCRQ
jgi:hypothetical protein